MDQEQALNVIGRIDIKSYPTKMNLAIRAAKRNDGGITYTIKFGVKSNKPPFGWVRLSATWGLNPEGLAELDIVRYVRNAIAYVMLHELDESLKLDGKIVAVPHRVDPEDGIIMTIPPCMCVTYMCAHRE